MIPTRNTQGRPQGVEDLTSAALLVLLALVDVYEREGRATVRRVAAAAGRSVGVTHGHLCTLRDAGLVEWEPRHFGTLRPLVRRGT